LATAVAQSPIEDCAECPFCGQGLLRGIGGFCGNGLEGAWLALIYQAGLQKI
jgi:hypothetical protein